jgi:TolA-binding protein
MLCLVGVTGHAHSDSAASRKPEEHSVVGAEKATSKGLPAPENLESLIFLSQRPAAGKTARDQRGTQLLEKMLHEREALVRVRRAEAIAQLQHFVAEEPESAAELPDALLRLAELRWEQARASYLEDYTAWQKAPERVRAANPPKAQIELPLSLYDRILAQHRDFARYDLVLYMKAYALMEAARMNEALACYQRIIDEFPRSRFVPDAHMAFAEWHFNASFDYQAALLQYEQVLRYPQSELSDLALFKSAWCLWKLGQVNEAALRFRQVLDLGGQLVSVSGERRRRLLELQDQALEYLIQVFTEDEHNTAADLHRFLAGIGGDQYALRVLKRLSRAFFDQARYLRAIEAYEMLLASEPDDASAPGYQRQIAAAYAAVDAPDAVVEALDVLATKYAPGSAWAKKQADPEVVARAQRGAERAVRTQAMRYHERAQKEKQTQDFQHAVQLYRVHVARFADSEASYEVMFYLAEILFHRLGQPEEAGDYYVRAARANPTGKLSKDALYNAIIAFESVRVKELQGCKPGAEHPSAAAATSGATAGSPQPSAATLASGANVAAPAAGSAQPPSDPCSETATDHKFSDAIAFYVQLFPNDPEVPGILFRQGHLYFERGIYDPAIRLFGQLLDSYPQSPYAATAGELVLESFNRAQDYGNIERWARKLKRAPAFQNAESQKKLDALILQSVFKAGEQLAARGEHKAAAAAYQRAAQEFPRDERTPKAYYNAGQEWQRAGDLQAAAEAYDALIEQHAGSSEGALGAWSAAQMFESIAQFRDAARYYEAYAKRFPKADKREDALYNAIVLRVAAADDQAVEDGNEFMRSFPAGSSTDEVYFLIGRAHEAQKRWAQAADTYRRYAKAGKNADRRIEANTRLGQMLLAQGDRDGADKAWAAAAKAGRKAEPGGGRYFAAQARFLQADQALAEFEKIQIAGDMKGLGKRLQQKSEHLRKAAEVYGDVVEYRVSEWLTAALYKIGQSYELFAEALRNAPIPQGLNEQEEQAYRDELAKFIVPIEERALEAYESGYHKALELRVFNTWTQKQREALTRLNDVQYPPLREAGAELSQAPLELVSQPFDGLRRQGAVDAQPKGATKAHRPAPSSKHAKARTQKSMSGGAP